jgi:glutamyl-tRNA reductase
MQLIACKLEVSEPAEREAIVQGLGSDPTLLVLNTCQRLESFGTREPDFHKVRILERWTNAAAFERLARIAAGLESRILGELEILGQVRQAYRQFREVIGEGDNSLDRVFQDILSLARKARRESGIDQKVTSLSALASRELLARVPAGEPVAVVGSGSLAAGVARYLSERGNSPIRIAGRCPENAISLANEVNGFGCGLDNLLSLFSNVAGIVTATAAPHPVVYAHHIAHTKRPLVIVDLGVPADCAAEVRHLSDLEYISLSNVETQAQVNVQERKQRAEVAAHIIRQRSMSWSRRKSISPSASSNYQQ